MLMDQPIPTYVGQGAPIANVGDMENWGLEFEMGWKQSLGDFKGAQEDLERARNPV